jgi:hypothetical protein
MQSENLTPLLKHKLSPNQSSLTAPEPKSFGSLCEAKLPVVCKVKKHNNKVWFVRSLFQAWLHHRFYPVVKICITGINLAQKAPLLISSVPGHPDNVMEL